jgi:hypothetical protein
MSIVGSEQWMYSAGAEFYDFPIEQSLRFEDSDSAYLSRNMSASNRRTFTISCWVKRSNLDSDIIMGRRIDGNNQWVLQFQGGGQLDFYSQTGGSVTVRMITNAVFRDPSAWYHITCKVDVTTGTSANAIYVNGVEQSLSTDTSSNSDTYVNSSGTHYIGQWQAGGSYDGYMADFNFVDGTAYTADSFGELKSGIWIPKDTADLTFGTNGFRLQFGDSAAIGDDTSGNTNDWTANNLVASDVVLDSPTNNWCVWSPLTANSSAQFKEGNLEAAAADNRGVMASFNMPSGKWYWEVRKDANSTLIGIAPDTLGTEDVPNSSGENGVFYYFDGRVFQNGSSLGNYGSFTNGDIIGMTFDSSNREIKFYKNNSLAHTVTAAAGFTYAPAISAGSANAFVQGNFGQDSTFANNTTAGGNADGSGYGDFKYAPPSGFLSLCSANLPTGAIDTLADETPTDYFDTILYTAATSDGTYTHGDLTFRPDFTWIKNRNNIERHFLIDVVRGNTSITDKFLVSNSTAAEGANGVGGTIFSVTDTGYEFVESSINTDELYFNGRTYVGWNWKAGGTGVSNTDGSITSTVSVGATSQQNWFSVVGYTGTGANATIGHGLGQTPDAVIVKQRSAAGNHWVVWTNALSGTQFLYLDATNAPNTNANIWNSTTPTSSVFSVGSDAQTNGSGNNLVAYCFANAEGLCKVGSYTGNGSADGTFVFTGHKPAWVMIKNINVSTHHWSIYDNKRGPYNAIDPIYLC